MYNLGQENINPEEVMEKIIAQRASLVQGIAPGLTQGQALIALVVFNIFLNKILGATARGARSALGGAANRILGRKKVKKKRGSRVRKRS